MVYAGDKQVGVYARKSSGATTFRYHDSWLGLVQAFPVSLSLPLSTREWTGAAVEQVFDGLLPDSPGARAALAAHTGAESAGVFDLLAEIGRDCVGAFRFLPPGEEPGSARLMRAQELSKTDVAQRLATLSQHPLGVATRSSESEDFRISLAGNQEKTALLQIDNDWHLPLGSTPTSHIFKPPMRPRPDGVDMSDSPWNEWFCLKLCEAFGLPSAKARIQHFDGHPVLVVERFDRRWQGGVLYRLPQEDLCQALGVSPTRKYEADGGPGIPRILSFLHQSARPQEDRLAFLKTQIVYWLLSAIDGHAKNFSIFLRPDGFSPTPVYDVMSAAPYHPKLAAQKIKLAMAIGRNQHYRISEIMPRHFYQTAQMAGLATADVDTQFDSIEKTADSALQGTIVDAEHDGMPSQGRDAIVDTVNSRIRLLQFAAPSNVHSAEPVLDHTAEQPGSFFN